MKPREQQIHLGFEVGSGERVSVPLGHSVVFGQSQLAGKTTALEALITRADVPAIAFVTKRGEGGFSQAREISPYLVERTDWQFVQAILESTIKSKQDFKQSWIMRACEGASTLADVQANAKRLMQKAKRDFDRDMYYVLDRYFDLVIPQIRRLPRSDSIELAHGVNVMALDEYTPELQALVISSAISWVHKKEKGVVTIIPEAWRFLPQGKRSPVRDTAQDLVREGAGLKNFMWVDSQDIAGVEKMMIRQAQLWLIGVQREKNELKRNMDNIPEGFAKPKPRDVATLELGQFFACYGTEAPKTYVQPAWMDDQTARAIARGERSTPAPPPPRVSVGKVIVHVPAPKRDPIEPLLPNPAIRPARKEQPMSEKTPALPPDIQKQLASLAIFQKAMRDAGLLASDTFVPTQPPDQERPAPSRSQQFDWNGQHITDAEQFYQQLKARLAAEAPQILSVTLAQPELEVVIERTKVRIDGETTKGRVAALIAHRFLREPKNFKSIMAELNRTGARVKNNKALSVALSELVKQGFLTRGDDAYVEVAGMIVNLVEK